jgi:phosphatidylserine decarboxylase precursor
MNFSIGEQYLNAYPERFCSCHLLRKLKPSARPVEAPDDPYRLVSGADCRLMAFETVNEASRLWIKGREFSVARLLGDAYKNQADRYTGGALAIFRLAPQDYHRFHSPVDGTIGPMTFISGEYYTVNVCPLNIHCFRDAVLMLCSVASSDPHYARRLW